LCTAEEEDVYQRTTSGTLLISTGNSKPLGPPPPSALTTVPGSPGASTTPAIHGQSQEGAAIKIYKSPTCSGEQAEDPGGQPAAGTAEQLADPDQGIAVKVAEGAQATFYATAELGGIVSACSKGVTYRQQSSTPPLPPPPPPPPPPTEGGAGGDGELPVLPGRSKTGSRGTVGPGGISYKTPESLITFGPAFKTRKRRPVFRFEDATGQPNSRFRCRLDKRRWRTCRSPLKLPKVNRGRHVFQVRATNAVGVHEERPAKRAFKLVHSRRPAARRARR
jgi:hypothetical protein